MRRTVLILLTLLLASCSGGREADPIADSASPKTSGSQEGSARTESDGSNGPTVASGAQRPGRTGDKGATPSALPSGPARHNTMALKVSMSPCVEPGKHAEATAVTAKGARLAFAAAYDDNTLPPDFTYIEGAANPTGTFTWRWLIRPNVPAGDGLLTVVASKDKNGASFDLPFRVKRAC